MINWRHWRTELFCIQVESFLSIFHKLINSFCLVGQAYWVLMDYIHTFFRITFDLVFSAGTPCGWMIVSSFGDLFGVIVKSCFWITISSIIYFQSLFLFRELRCVIKNFLYLCYQILRYSLSLFFIVCGLISLGVVCYFLLTRHYEDFWIVGHHDVVTSYNFSGIFPPFSLHIDNICKIQWYWSCVKKIGWVKGIRLGALVLFWDALIARSPDWKTSVQLNKSCHV